MRLWSVLILTWTALGDGTCVSYCPDCDDAETACEASCWVLDLEVSKFQCYDWERTDTAKVCEPESYCECG